MSLYWQQAVQNRGTAPQHGAQNHGQNNGDVTKWNSTATAAYWNQAPINNGTEQSQYNQHPPISSAYHHGFAGHEAQSYPTATSSYSNSTIQHMPMFTEPHGTIQYYPVVSSVAFNYGQPAGVSMPHAQPGYETAYTTGGQYQSATSERITQVSSLSSIPEFETVDIPVTATALIQPVAPPVVSHVQEHRQVDLTVESVDQKQSSQVTPESSYSVDTFGSTVTKEQEKVKDDEWDDWEQTPRELHERSPNDFGSVVSEPAVMMHSDKSRETSVASTNDHIQNGYDFNNREEHERHTDMQPIAQVAPLIKNTISEPFEQPVARVGPVHQALDQVPNIGRVAPTRSVQRHLVIETSEQQASDHSETTVAPAPTLSSHEAATAPIPSVVTSEVASPITSSSPEHHVEVNSENIESTNMLAVQMDADRITPDTVAVLNGSIPGEAQATSTPLTEQREEERLVERRSSQSSVRDVIPPQHPVTTNGDHSDSTQGSFAFTRAGHQASYNQRYRGVKEKYLGHRSDIDTILQRMESRRTDTPKMARNNPLVDVSTGNRRAGMQISARGPSRADQSNSSFGAMTDMNQSVDLGNNSVGYGDDFVDASRRSRLNRSRPSSRVGEDASFQRAHVAHGHHKHLPDLGYSSQYYGHHPAGRHQGRMSAMGIPYQNEYYQPQAMLYHHQRSHSTFDARSMERFQRAGGNMMKYDVYAQEDDDLDESVSNESELEDEQGDSDDEMRAYNMHRAVNNSFSNYSVASHQRRGHQQFTRHYGAEELYYFGLIRLDTAHVDNFFRRIPPPREFYTALNPMQKAAYLYFAVLFSKLYPRGVAHFHDQFNSEFYKYKSTGLPPHEAFIKVCKAMYDERQSSQQKAYEASQKQLFSDDRDSADGLSDRASVYDKDDDRASDIMSIDSTQRAPLKFTTQHAFTRFGPGGKRITVQPDLSMSEVHIDDVKTALRDNQSRRIIDAAYNFKGPLDHGRIPNHSILLYIQNQIHRIRCSEVAKENPNSCDVIDCLLLWQLLETVVQQHGRVTGPDIARLLIAAGASTSRRAHSNHREKSATPSMESTRSSASVDPKAYERFTQFLLGGHVDEAVECAVRDGLYADAMVLVRRIFAGDERKLAEIEARFLTTRPSSNPVMTLVSVASGQPAPVLTNPPIDDVGSWRSHAAIVLANLNTGHARETVYRLGRVLAKREYHAAADFCFLAVSLLSNFEGINVFEPLPESELEGNERQHVSLVHASLPDDEWDSTACRFGFSLTDLFATEIFDFAIRLSAAPNYVTPLQTSVEYQRRRLQYAQLLNSLGGFSAEAYRYLCSIANAIWFYTQKFSYDELSVFTDLADSLRYYAPVDLPDTTWIEKWRDNLLRTRAAPAVSQEVHIAPVQENNEPLQISAPEVAHDNQEITATESADYYQQQPAVPHIQETEQNPMSSRSRSESLATEARNWHEDRQDPIQISPRMSTATPLLPSVNNGDLENVTSPPLDSYQTPRGRTGSHSSHTNKMGYGEQLCNTQQQHYAAAARYHEYDDSHLDSVDTTSHESTPVRQQRDTTSSSSTTVTTDAWSSQPPQPPVMQQPPVVNQPAYHTTSAPASQQNLSAPQNQSSTAATNAQKTAKNGLQKSGSNNSSGILSSFVNKLRKTIPLNDEMKLPDDKAPSIRWDPDLNKWVGDGVENETVAAPPPKMDKDPAIPPSVPQSGMTGLRAARGGGGSRYFNPLTDNSNPAAAPVPAPLAPPTMPLNFNFIPTMPDDADSVDPFSGESNPTVHGAEQATASS